MCLIQKNNDFIFCNVSQCTFKKRYFYSSLVGMGLNENELNAGETCLTTQNSHFNTSGNLIIGKQIKAGVRIAHSNMIYYAF
jgi:hypothetical protein